jgi:hypothetical protein
METWFFIIWIVLTLVLHPVIWRGYDYGSPLFFLVAGAVAFAIMCAFVWLYQRAKWLAYIFAVVVVIGIIYLSPDKSDQSAIEYTDPCSNVAPEDYYDCRKVNDPTRRYDYATATHRPNPTAIPTSKPKPTSSVCVKVPRLNVRAGPGINYSIVDFLSQGQCVDVLGCNPDSTWLNIGNGLWISAGEQYVVGFVDCLIYPQSENTSRPVPTEYYAPTATTSTGCPVGCIYHKAGCDIKGNVSFNTGEKIYHLPGDSYYDTTEINPDYGERWFCTEDEARANGWRHAYP